MFIFRQAIVQMMNLNLKTKIYSFFGVENIYKYLLYLEQLFWFSI